MTHFTSDMLLHASVCEESISICDLNYISIKLLFSPASIDTLGLKLSLAITIYFSNLVLPFVHSNMLKSALTAT